MVRARKIFSLSVLIILYFLLALYWIIFNSQVSWQLLLFLTLFLGVNGLSMFQSLTDLTIQPITLESTHVGKEQQVIIELISRHKRSLFYPVLYIRCEALSLNQSYFFYYKKKVIIELDWIPEKRELIEALDIELVSYDFFQFFSKTKKIKIPQNILVLPSLISSNDQLMNQLKTKFQKIPFGEMSYNLEKIKAYQKGDSPKKIDWKLSSKQQQLMVREYESSAEKPLMFVFFGRESKYFESTLALFFYLYTHFKYLNISFYLIGEGVLKETQFDLKEFIRISPSENPGELPISVEQEMIILTPRPTKFLDKQLEKLPPRQSVHVIEYRSLKGGEKNELS